MIDDDRAGRAASRKIGTAGWLAVAMFLGAAAIALLPGTAAAAPATLNVATDGTDAGDCVAEACATIQYAVDQAAAGDTIDVGPGTYAEEVTVSKEVSLRGADAGIAADDGARGAETVVEGGAGWALKVSAAGVSVDGFTLSGAGGGTYGTRADSLRFADNVVRSGQGRGLYLTLGSANDAVEGNLLEGWQYGLAFGPGAYPGLRVAGNSIASANPNGYAVFNGGEGSTFAGMQLSGNSISGVGNIGGSIENGVVSGNRFDAASLPLALQIDLHESTLSGNSFEGEGTGGCLQLFGSQYELDPSADSAVSGNSFHGCDPYAIQLSPGLERIAITGNTITDSYDGIDTRLPVENEGPWSVEGEQISIVGNRIVGIENLGIDNLAEGTLAASDNWWGCNAGPAAVAGNGCAPVSAGVVAEPWLVLTGSAPESVQAGESATVTAAIDTDSSGAHVAAVPDGTPVTYSTDLGSLDTAAAATAGGAAATHLVSAAAGLATVAATVDDQTVTSAVRIDAPPQSTPPPAPPAPAPPAPAEPPEPPAPQVQVAGAGAPVAVSAGGAVQVAAVGCPQGSCRIAVQQRKVTVGGRGFPVQLKLDKFLGEGESTRVTAVLPARARKALAAKGKGQAIVKLRVFSASGTEVIPVHVRLKAPRRGR